MSEADIEKKTYELGYLITVPDKEKSITQTIEQSGGVIVDGRSAAETRLAYPIKKHESAYFGVCYFMATSEVPAKLNEAFKLDPQILRFLMVVRVKKEPKVKKEKKVAERPVIVPQPVAEVTNEALEEKLEEILK
jgi:ribosomal protein S6